MKVNVRDWKFALTTLITIACAAIPYFWQADFSAHSLTFRVISSSALELPSDSKIHDLQITVNGSKIESPHVYSFALVNTGSKPILSADFETPLEIRTKNDSTIVTAHITGSEPADIPAKLTLEDNRLAFSPFLSNPKDEVTVNVVSSGPLDLEAHARIAGVRDILFEDITRNHTRPSKAILSGLVAVFGLTLYLFFIGISDFRSITRIGPLIKIPTSMICIMSGVFFAIQTVRELGITGYLVGGFILLLFIISLPISILLSRSNRTLNPKP